MAKEYSITNLLEQYNVGRLCKPEIQREYVWTNEKVRSLLDSLYRDYPVGLLLFWKPTDKNHLKRLKSQGHLFDPQLAVIDGQQRITSLFKVQQAEKDKLVMFNVKTEEFQMENPNRKKADEWIYVHEIWKNFKKTSSMAIQLGTKLYGQNDNRINDISNRIQAVANILFYDPNVHVIDDDDYEKITTIFVRINESGVKLQQEDIALAIGALKFPGLLIPKLENLRDINIDWNSITRTKLNWFVKALTGLTANQINKTTIKKVFDQTKENKLKQNLKVLEKSISQTQSFLTDNFGIDQKNNLNLISSANVFLILVNYFAYTNNQLPTKNSELLRLWTFLAFHHGRYSGQSQSKTNEDLRALQPKTTDTIKTWIQSIKDVNGSLQVKQLGEKTNNTSMFTLFFALQLNKADDWWSGTSIKSIKDIEFHHIFPTNVLTGNYKADEINDPRNKAIVSLQINRKLSDTPPEKYFVDKKFISDIDRIYSQFVPNDPELWKVKNYKSFLEERGKLIMKKLNDFVSKEEAKI